MKPIPVTFYRRGGGHPEYHLQVDAAELLKMRWDMIIAHPPCTYLSNAGAKHLWKNHELNVERYQQGLEAKDFFMKFLNANCPKVAVENPIPSKIYELPPHSQSIQPYEYGHPFQKKTLLWLRGLPNLEPTEIVSDRQSTRNAGNWFNKGGKDRQRNRARTFPGIAKAIAEQWAGQAADEENMSYLERIEKLEKELEEIKKQLERLNT